MAAAVCAAPPDVAWTDDTYADFRAGQFDASGHNLIATAKGELKTVYRFDLNTDGFLDLVFSTSHDFVTAPPATLYQVAGGRGPGRASELPPMGTSHAAVADLNKDGVLDLVLTPNNNWVTARRYLFILWGGSDGWSAKRMTNLLTMAPRALRIADVDNDGWLDIAVINGSRWAPEDGPETLLRVYWGSEHGFRQEAYFERVERNAVDLEVADLDGDKRPELVVLHSGPGEVLVYWSGEGRDGRKLGNPSRVDLAVSDVARLGVLDFNRDGKPDLIVSGGIKEQIGADPTTGQRLSRHSGLVQLPGKQGRGWGQPRRIPAPSASALAVADLNKDGWPDLILADGGAARDSVQIMWGDRGGGYDRSPPTKLPIAYAAAVATADLDSDGNLDLVAGVARAVETYQAESKIFHGDGTGRFAMAAFDIPTAAVTDVAVAPPDKTSGYRLIFCNRLSGRIDEDVPTRVFWGAKGGFVPSRFSDYQIRSGYASIAADLNDDGYPDLVMASIVHNVADPRPDMGFHILWGDKDGLNSDRRTLVPEQGLFTLNVADLDQDGYLDLIGNCTPSPSKGGDPARVVIWYGGRGGFDRKRRHVLESPGAQGTIAVGDFNRDGFLDLAASRWNQHTVSIFWNGPQGFVSNRRLDLPLVSPDDISVADLNSDGWLDLIVTSFFIPGTHGYDFGTYLFWGGPDGFKPTNAQRLPSGAGCGVNVADYDGDRHLDLFIPNYHMGGNRTAIPSFLYWGRETGFSELNRTSLTVDSGHGSLSADFNQDGLIDLAISNHATEETHVTHSRVYYNDRNRFAQPPLVRLPTVGSHYMYRAEVGHIYNRSYRQSYDSRVFRWSDERHGGTLAVRAQTPGGSRLQWYVRSAPTEAELAARRWIAVAPTGAPLLRFDVSAPDRCLQYRAEFVSDNGDRYPVVDSVQIRLN
ncbi:MAG: FG-GAP repeat domain-containing protein [Bryobacteraceae bacterium]